MQSNGKESIKEDPQFNRDEENSGFEIFDEPKHYANDVRCVQPEQVLKRLLEQVLNSLFE